MSSQRFLVLQNRCLKPAKILIHKAISDVNTCAQSYSVIVNSLTLNREVNKFPWNYAHVRLNTTVTKLQRYHMIETLGIWTCLSTVFKKSLPVVLASARSCRSLVLGLLNRARKTHLPVAVMFNNRAKLYEIMRCNLQNIYKKKCNDKKYMYKQTIRPYPLMVRLHQCLGRSFRKQVPAAHKSYLPNLHDKHILYTVHNAQLTRFTLNSPLTVWFNTDGRHRTIWACLASSM